MIEKEGVELFGQLLRRRRRYLEMTLEQLAHESMVSITTIKNIEKGLQQPSLSTTFKLCEVLKVNPAPLVEQTWESWQAIRKQRQAFKNEDESP